MRCKLDVILTRVSIFYFISLCFGSAFYLGILSYKTNTPKSMRFNVLGLMNYMNTELLIGMSCDVANAFDALPKFTAMLQSIEVNE